MQKYAQLIGFFATCVLGTLLHFLYEWTGGSYLAAPFSGVNESTWEHMKLLYWPLVIVALLQWIAGCRKWRFPENFCCIKLIGTLTGLVLIPILYYTYNGCFGKSPDWLNISFFYLSAAVVFLLESRLFTSPSGDKFTANRFSGYAFVILGCAFIYYTFCPPQLPLFQDPMSSLYGIPK